jgi:hypothetical protein
MSNPPVDSVDRASDIPIYYWRPARPNWETGPGYSLKGEPYASVAGPRCQYNKSVDLPVIWKTSFHLKNMRGSTPGSEYVGVLGAARPTGKPINLAAVQAINDRLAHRGPDVPGYLVLGEGGEKSRLVFASLSMMICCRVAERTVRGTLEAAQAASGDDRALPPRGRARAPARGR